MRTKINSVTGRLFILFTAFRTVCLVSGQVGINITTPHPSSILDLNSTTRGLLAPRLKTAQRIAMVSPANGLIVYDTTPRLLYSYTANTTAWCPVGCNISERLNFNG